MNDQRPYNAIVIGLGAMGSATLCHLALRGWRVLGLEQFAAGHSLGSSHGDSRIIRETYFEHPLYVPLVQRAHELWRELEERSGASLMTINGGIMIGPPDGIVVAGSLRSAVEHNLPHELLTPEATRERFPAFHLADDLVAVLDPARRISRSGSMQQGAPLARATPAPKRASTKLCCIGQRTLPECGVVTAAGSYSADRLRDRRGSLERQPKLRDLRLPLTVERQSVFWLEPDGETEVV